jgi:hypothetical protein
MDNKCLIEQMVQETFENTAEDSNVISLTSRKNNKLSATYDEDRKCLILRKDNKKLEVPHNWGPFRENFELSVQICSKDDSLLFFQLISEYFNISSEKIDIEIKNSNFIFQANKAA